METESSIEPLKIEAQSLDRSYVSVFLAIIFKHYNSFMIFHFILILITFILLL